MRIPRACRGALAALIACALTQFAVPAAAADAGPALAVDAAQDRHPISPDIYGINFADQALADELDLPVDRWGGNLFEAYNWQLGSTNFAADNYFENAADCFVFTPTCGGGDPPFYRTFVERARARGTQPLMTLPLMGQVAKDAKTDHPFTCSYPQASYPAQDAFDPFDPACGNGRSGGTPIPGDPAKAGMPTTAAFARDWVSDLASRYGTAASGGVRLYGLGNEPGLWHETHSDMHPAKVTYDELRDRTVAYAAAVKDADPTAMTLGFSEWGWPNYFCSAADDKDDGCFATDADRMMHGGKPLVNWLLGELQSASATAGRRLLDYLDVHYYSQGFDGANPTDVTRSLWDPTYTDPSFIDDEIRLLPRMSEWVAADYPGTKRALSEYNVAVRNPSIPAPERARLDVLVEADALGIFGREGLDLAAYFDVTPGKHLAQGMAVADAFRLFRSYDGAGARFGDVSTRATSADQSRLAVYSAERSADGALTVAVINKSDSPLASQLSVAGFVAAGAAQVWRWEGSAITRGADATLDGRAHEFPARSMTLFVLARKPDDGGPGGGSDNPGSDDPGGGDPCAVAPFCQAPGPPGATDGDDVLAGDALANLICGLLGDDVIDGGAGDDTLYGDACPAAARQASGAAAGGDDRLSGGAGRDRLYGQGGSDKLSGGSGRDTLTGGTGNDSLTGGAGVNSYAAGPGTDVLNARNHVRERVDCGAGRKDRATVDRRDRVHGCERVKRAKR